MNTQAPTQTTCPYCGVGCGILATPTGPEAADIQGDPAHPANFGRLCSKGAALGETLSLQTRLLHPHIGQQRVTWDTALDKVAGEFRRIIDTHGPDAVAFYVSGQLLTEDYYIANKLMKGYIGSANIDTNSRLCMSSTVAGQKRALGEDVVPGCYEDLDLADLIVLVGSNTAWCHPVLFQRIAKARQDNPKLKLIVIDPRRTTTAESADLHLAIRPGTDVLLFSGLLNYLRKHDRLNYSFLESHLSGLAEALHSASDCTIPTVAATCGIAETDLASFYQSFARTEKTVTAWSQGVNQSSAGTDKVNAILNVHLATGRIGKPGMGPLSLTGQPNAMGGREVGGLANQLAAHLDLDNPDHRALVQVFWNAPHVAERPGLKAVDLFRAVSEGKVKAVWIMATNPAVSLPDANAVRAALASCEFVAVSECEANTDLVPYAHVSLPAAAWGEKSGTVTNSERRISRQRSFLPLPGEARPDWWIMCEVAKRLGFREGFEFESPYEIFREHARLSGFFNHGERRFDISGLADLNVEAYDALQPVQWPVNAEHPYGTARLFGAGGFSGPSQRAKLLPLAHRAPAHAPDEEYPLVLNTGRIRDQWHTMTRTGKTPRLTRHLPEPYAELHPRDAIRFGIEDGALVRLASRHGQALARARVSQDQQPGSVFMPMHWTFGNAPKGGVNPLVNPVVDPLSGEPELKHTPVWVEPYRAAWYGFLLAREPLELAGLDYRVSVRGEGYWLHELAGQSPPENWRDWARGVLQDGEAAGEWLEFADPHAGRYRCAVLREGKLHACLFASTGPELPPRDWLGGLFAHEALPDADRTSLLAGRPASPIEDKGRIVCSCHGVGAKTLVSAIRQRNLTTPEEIGRALHAGTQCGSCVPELRGLLRQVHGE